LRGHAGICSVRWARAGDATLPFVAEGIPASVIETRIANRCIAIGEQDGQPVGALQLEYLWGTRPYIAMIRVQPDYQRLGVGRALLAFVEVPLRAEGAPALLSSAQTNEPAAQAWHRHVGFVECGVITGVNDGDVGELFFRKSLVPK
jgi:ribosomal protein S18 acetylase RimI-like enzyme